MTCYRNGGCGPYEMCACNECPASRPEYADTNTPVANAAHLVYCRDCRHITFSDCYGECGKGYLGIVQPNDFCSRGEHKEAK